MSSGSPSIDLMAGLVLCCLALLTAPARGEAFNSFEITSDSSIPGDSNSTLTASFSVDTDIVVGTSIHLHLPGFNTGIAASPTVTLVSGWGGNGVNGAFYSSSSGALTMTLSGSGSIAADTLVTLSLSVSTNPPAGSYLATVAIGTASTESSSPLIFNTPPVFVAAGPGALTLPKDSAATEIKDLLHVSDVDGSQTLTWSQSGGPSHGALGFSNSSADSGGADIAPDGSITYTPTPGYVGPDSFTVLVDDGMSTATRTINVLITDITVTINGTAAGAADTVLRVSFSVAAPIQVGDTVTLTLGGFGNGIASSPAVQPVSGWGPVGFINAVYSAATGTLTWSTTTFAVPANTFLTVDLPVRQNPAAGSYQVTVKTTSSPTPIPALAPIVFYDPPRMQVSPESSSELFILAIEGAIDQVVVVESSSDLEDWSFRETITLNDGTAVHSDPDGFTPTRRFYRAYTP